MKVTRIDWLAKAADEALVIVTDGTYEIAAYSQPCEFAVGEKLSMPLMALGVQGLRVIPDDAPEPSIIKRATGLGYEIAGEVADRESRLIAVGGIRIESDVPLAKDIKNGATVVFSCDRVDIWKKRVPS